MLIRFLRINEDQGHAVSQHIMSEICEVAVDVSRRYVGDEVAVVQIPDSQLDLRPLVVIFPGLLWCHVRLIVTEDLIVP